MTFDKQSNGRRIEVECVNYDAIHVATEGQRRADLPPVMTEVVKLGCSTSNRMVVCRRVPKYPGTTGPRPLGWVAWLSH